MKAAGNNLGPQDEGIDVVEEPTSEALSLETECGLRFVLRQEAGGSTR